MSLDVTTTLNYIEQCLLVATGLPKAALKRLGKFFTSLADRGKTTIACEVVMFKLARTGLSKSTMEINNFFSIMESLGRPGLLEQLQKKKALSLAKQVRGQNEPSELVDRATFRRCCARLLDKGQLEWVVALHGMLATGRRRRDFSRVDAARTTKLPNSVFALQIPFDKKNSQPISFLLDFASIPEGWGVLSGQELSGAFEGIIDGGVASPFQFLSSSSAARDIGFRCHGLRSIRAIRLTRLGLGDQEILEAVGWSDLRSLKRYRRLSRVEILAYDSLEQVIERCNGGHRG